MNIFKNFLPEEDFKKFKIELFEKEFPWFYRDKQLYYVKNDKTFYFSHGFIKDQTILSDYYKPYIEPILEKLKATSILEVRANLLVNTGKKQKSVYHIDFPTFKNKTAILYMNTCNGFTSFEKNKNIPCEENKIVIFNNGIKHAAVSQTDSKRRIVINFNYF